jgi:hypothetical protein
MIIGVISDTHIPDRARDISEQLYGDLDKCDLILHAGDLVSMEFLEKLKKIKKVIAVSGNMDYPEVLKALPKKQVIECGKFRIGLIHGYGHPVKMLDNLHRDFDQEIDLLVFGHSHQPMNEVRDGILYFNPGSPTDKLFSIYNSYGIIEIDEKINCKIVRI